jgi:hypothetical protein
LALARWTFKLYPDAGEGGGCLYRAAANEPSWGRSPDPARSSAEAARRARGKVRRYCAANGLNRLGTLTYAGAGCHDPAQLPSDVGEYFKRLRASSKDGRKPYVWVPQWHPGGHGLHVHFAVGRYVPHRLIHEAWGHGIVHIKLLSGLPVGSGARAEARLAARYLARYIGRELDGQRPAGLHRYEVAQGFQPAAIQCQGRTVEQVIEHASEVMGSTAERVWHSADTEGWHGPPACWAQWR